MTATQPRMMKNVPTLVSRRASFWISTIAPPSRSGWPRDQGQFVPARKVVASPGSDDAARRGFRREIPHLRHNPAFALRCESRSAVRRPRRPRGSSATRSSMRNNTPIIVGAIAVVGLVVAGLWLVTRNDAGAGVVSPARAGSCLRSASRPRRSRGSCRRPNSPATRSPSTATGPTRVARTATRSRGPTPPDATARSRSWPARRRSSRARATPTGRCSRTPSRRRRRMPSRTATSR